MSLTSMTGFAETQGECCNQSWRWEAKSVNGRGLDLRWRLPQGFEKLEAEGRTMAAGKFRRGNIQISLTLEKSVAAPALKVDEAALTMVIGLAEDAAAKYNLPQPQIATLMGLKGVLTTAEPTLSPEDKITLCTALRTGLEQLFADLDTSRKTEGEKLTTLMAAHVDRIETLTEKAANQAATQPAHIRERLSAQIADLVAPGTVNEERMAQEVAMLAVRADVREELDRLKAHITEARRLITAGAAVGRKLDFLSQEFNRETNTLCSKSSDVALTRVGLDLKAVIDQFREQAANVE